MPQFIQAKTILNKTRRRDSWFLDDYTLNPYSGCSFNCLYCYIRGSKYGEHMQEKVSVKQNAVDLLEKQLANRAKKGQHGFIVLSSATDPYLHLEKELKLTRQLLEVILHYRFPVHVITKSDMVCRDIDILKQIGDHAILPPDLAASAPAKVFITFSFSSVDDKVAAIFEPGATPPSIRLKALQAVLEAGLYAGVSMMPLLPFISDTADSLHRMFGAFKQARVKYVMPATLTLFGSEISSSKTLTLRAIRKHYPSLEEKYLRWFNAADELPGFYQQAFYKKMKQLSVEYSLPEGIMTY